MPTVPQCPGLIRTGNSGNGFLVTTLTVSGSTTSTWSIVAMLVRPGAACWGLSIRSMLNLTAAASKGSP